MSGEHKVTRTLTPEDVAAVPQPGLAQPVDFRFSPDDALITFLHSPDRSRTRQLYAFDPATRARGIFLEPPSEGRDRRECVARRGAAPGTSPAVGPGCHGLCVG